tara:strand:- start:73 stop:360 length:288 start_codon:yes stop_codon:yes gene_type:complete
MSENSNKDSTEHKPVIADKMPAVIKLDAGEYWWCSCGKSSKQPFLMVPTKAHLSNHKRSFLMMRRMWLFVIVSIQRMKPFVMGLTRGCNQPVIFF